MSCTQTLSGISKDCAPNLGGVREVYIANASDVTVTVDETTGKATVTATNKYKKYSFPRGLASMTSTATIDATTGAKYFTTDVVLQFNRMDATKRLEMLALLSIEASVIVKDENGSYWLLDNERPTEVSAMDGATGTAVGDANKYGVTLQVLSPHLPFEVESIEGLVDEPTVTK